MNFQMFNLFLEKAEAVTDFLFLGSIITTEGDGSHEIRKTIASWQESCDKPRQCVKKQRRHFADKDPSSQGYGLFSSHVRMRKLDHKEGRALKNLCF